MKLLRRYRAWRLKRHSRRHRKAVEEYFAMTDEEKADHYWKGRGL